MQVPTVKVKRDGPKGYRLINKSDFDPARHELFAPPVEEAKKPKPSKAKDAK